MLSIVVFIISKLSTEICKFYMAHQLTQNKNLSKIQNNFKLLKIFNLPNVNIYKDPHSDYIFKKRFFSVSPLEKNI